MTFAVIQNSFSDGGKLSPWPEPKASPAHPHLRMGPRYAVYPQSRINSASVPLATHPAMECFYNAIPDDTSDARRNISVLFSEYYSSRSKRPLHLISNNFQ